MFFSLSLYVGVSWSCVRVTCWSFYIHKHKQTHQQQKIQNIARSIITLINTLSPIARNGAAPNPNREGVILRIFFRHTN